MEWDNLRFFLAVARTGSLTAASEKLRTSTSTVSRRIEVLEEALNIKLFSHHQTGYQLTDEGKALYHNAEKVEDAMLSLEQDAMAQHTDYSGVVRVATAENIANKFITPALPEFLSRYPDIVLEIVPGIRSMNLTKREADVAIRMVRPDQGNVVVRKLGVLGYALYGSYDYFEKRSASVGDSLDNFQQDRFIVFSEEFSDLPAAQWMESTLAGRPPALIISSVYGQCIAAKSGLGLALLPCILGDVEPSLKRLNLPDPIEQSIWLVMHQNLRNSTRVRVVADFLTDVVHSNAAQFKG